MAPEPEQPAENWLEKRLATLGALYHRFGREGLKDQPIAEVGLLLSSKELQFRDTPKHNLTVEQQAANRQLELEIRDLTAYVKGQVVGLSLGDLRSYRPPDRPQQDQQRFKQKNRGMER